MATIRVHETRVAYIHRTVTVEVPDAYADLSEQELHELISDEVLGFNGPATETGWEIGDDLSLGDHPIDFEVVK